MFLLKAVFFIYIHIGNKNSCSKLYQNEANNSWDTKNKSLYKEGNLDEMFQSSTWSIE